MAKFKVVCCNCNDPLCDAEMLRCKDCGRLICKGEIAHDVSAYGVKPKENHHVFVMGHGQVWACGPLEKV